MPITITKHKAKGKTKDQTLTKKGTLEQLADTFGELKVKVDKFEKNKKYLETKSALVAAKTALLTEFDVGAKPTASVTLEGDKHIVSIGAKAAVRTVSDIGEIRRIMGDEAFMRLVSIKLGDIDDYLTPEQKDAVLSTEQSGSRKVTVKEV